MKSIHSHRSHCLVSTALAAVLAGLILFPAAVRGATEQELQSQFNQTVGDRVETLTVFGGDYGLSGGSFQSFRQQDGKTVISLDKFGGAGDIGDPQPLGNTGIGFQPRLQGSMGYAEAKKVDHSGDLNGDVNKYQTFAIQFGGGGRFWFNDHLSIAPTFMGMYGHTKNIYTANNPDTQAIAAAGDEQIVNWHVDTWTVRPAANIQYVQTWHRTIFTLSSDYNYFHTESFSSSSSLIHINGDSEVWENKLDVDVPLGKMLWGHELRTGGYFSREQFFDNLKSGLGTDHMYEIHGRVVLDFLGELWKVQWIGIGYSYMWGGPISGWAFGADIAFRF